MSPLFLMFRADFSPRGTCPSDFFSNLFSPWELDLQLLWNCSRNYDFVTASPCARFTPDGNGGTGVPSL